MKKLLMMVLLVACSNLTIYAQTVNTPRNNNAPAQQSSKTKAAHKMDHDQNAPKGKRRGHKHAGDPEHGTAVKAGHRHHDDRGKHKGHYKRKSKATREINHGQKVKKVAIPER